MKLSFILNPCSGKNSRRPWLADRIRSFIAEQHLDATVVVTMRPRHATELARTALVDGCDRVIAVGGDGTVNEVAQALLNSSVALGLIPCGSGNGLALHLGLPTQLERALELTALPDATISAIDTGVANGHAFFNAMGLGFDADISQRFNGLRRRGLLAYIRTGLRAFRERRTYPAVITTGQRHLELSTLLIAIANSDQYGNNARIAPGARVDDGKLDLIAIAPINVFTAVPLVARLFSGRLLQSGRVTHLRSAEFSIRRAEPGLIHTDGEIHSTSANVEIAVRPRSLHLILPPNRTERHLIMADQRDDALVSFHSGTGAQSLEGAYALPRIGGAGSRFHPPRFAL
ncbi:MAG: diacylglycerol kinase family protein [Opitutus sp.]